MRNLAILVPTKTINYIMEKPLLFVIIMFFVFLQTYNLYHLLQKSDRSSRKFYTDFTAIMISYVVCVWVIYRFILE